MRWKRTWNANSQDKYAGGSVYIDFSGCAKITLKLIKIKIVLIFLKIWAQNYNASLELRKT